MSIFSLVWQRSSYTTSNQIKAMMKALLANIMSLQWFCREHKLLNGFLRAQRDVIRSKDCGEISFSDAYGPSIT